MACFAMGFKLSPQEREMIRDITDQAMYAVTVINDLYSWPKEIKCHLETPGSELPFNAVAILMRHSGCSETEAFRILRQKQGEFERRHVCLLDELKAQLQREGSEISENLDLYMQTMRAAASGSELWSIHTQRYPSKEDLGQSEVEYVDRRFSYRADGVDTVTSVIEEKFDALKVHVRSVEPDERPATPPDSDVNSQGSSASPSSLKTRGSQDKIASDREAAKAYAAHAEQVSPFLLQLDRSCEIEF